MNGVTVPGKFFIPEQELNWQFTTATGPGGQHVNKVSTAVRLSFHPASSPSIPEHYRARLLEKLGGRLSADGMLTVTSSRARSQKQNRDEAVEKLAVILAAALVIPKKRRPTKPTAGSVERRIAAKKTRSAVKKMRRQGPDSDR